MKRKNNGRGRPKGEKTVVKRIPATLTVDNIGKEVRKIVREELDRPTVIELAECTHDIDTGGTSVPFCKKCYKTFPNYPLTS